MEKNWTSYPSYFFWNTEVGIYKRKQENKNSTKKATKKKRKKLSFFLDHCHGRFFFSFLFSFINSHLRPKGGVWKEIGFIGMLCILNTSWFSASWGGGGSRRVWRRQGSLRYICLWSSDKGLWIFLGAKLPCLFHHIRDAMASNLI